MKKLLLSLTIGSAALALMSPALASAQTTPPPPGAATHGRMADRTVTREEALAKADKMFDAIDTNHDGKITRDEMQAARAKMHEKMRERWQARRGDQANPAAMADGAGKRGGWGGHRGGMGMGMSERGGDPNRVITREEWRQKAIERFDRVDLNHDGKIDPQERAAARQQMREKMQERVQMRRDRRAQPPADGTTPPAPAPRTN